MIKKIIVALWILFFVVTLSLTAIPLGNVSAETCSGECVQGTTCTSGKSPTGEEGCATGSICCKSTSGTSTSTVEFPNPTGFTLVTQLLNKLLESLRGVVAVIAIIFIVLGGIMYMLSGGSEKMITRAKLCWTGAVIGLAIVLAAPSFLTEIINILGGSSGIESPGGPTLLEIGTRVLTFLLSILGIIAIISLVVGGGMYLTAYGDEKRIETGKKIVTYSIIGIIISLSAVVILNEVMRLITGS
jgi:type IV secretory pathway VirB2 component (pilin)